MSVPTQRSTVRVPEQRAVAGAVRSVLPAAVRVTAYDGSQGGPADASVALHVRSPRALTHLVLAPGGLGLARGYVSGLLDFEAPDHHAVVSALATSAHIGDLSWQQRLQVLRSLGPEAMHVVELPPQEVGAKRYAAGLRAHTLRRDAAAIAHHYDVSNTFYRWVLGPSMAYTCALYETPDMSLEEAQAAKFELVCRKLDLQPGQRLLDVGCGWGTMVRHAAREHGVRALGVTLSLEQAQWAKAAIDREGLGDLAEVRHLDYRDVVESGFDAVSSIGLTEHIGPRNYPAYFAFLRSKLIDGGRLLNHCITRPDNTRPGVPERGFINRYVFPDGGLTGSGDIVRAAEDAGFELRHHENLREHYALTCRDWCANLSKNWDEAVAEAGLGTARVWGLYLAGSRLSFERNRIQLHQVLLAKTDRRGVCGFGLEPLWPS